MSTGDTAVKTIQVVGCISMEHVVAALSVQVPNLQFNFHAIEDTGMESQQMDEAQREEALKSLQAQLRQDLDGERPTGALQLFLLDGAGVAASDPQSQATLRALARAALQDPGNTVAALLPENVKSVNDIPSSLPASVQAVVSEFLGAPKVAVFHDTSRLAEHLATV